MFPSLTPVSPTTLETFLLFVNGTPTSVLLLLFLDLRRSGQGLSFVQICLVRLLSQGLLLRQGTFMYSFLPSQPLLSYIFDLLLLVPSLLSLLLSFLSSSVSFNRPLRKWAVCTPRVQRPSGSTLTQSLPTNVFPFLLPTKVPFI